MKHYVVLSLLAVGALALPCLRAAEPAKEEPAGSPARAGAEANSPAGAGLGDLRRQIDQHVRLLGDRRLEVRKGAQDAVIRLYQDCLDAAAAASESADAPARQAIDAALGKMELRLAAGATIASSAGGRRKQLQQLLKVEPAWVEKVAGRNPAAVMEVLLEIGKLKDPNHPAQALAACCLDDPRAFIVRQALESIGKAGFAADTIVDALTEMVVRTPADLWDGARPWQNAPQWEAVKTLGRIGSPRAAPAILAVYLRSKKYMTRCGLADALIAGGELRLLPTMLAMIESQTCQTNYAGGGKKLLCTDGDIALHAVILLTGQKPEDYGLAVVGTGPARIVGFEKDETREEAVKKLHAWWEKNKTDPKYKDLQPLEVPPLAEPPKP